MHCGEMIAGVLLTGVLQAARCPAVFLTGQQAGILTDNNFGDAKILQINPKRILNHLQAGQVVVVAGFQGATPDGELTTLGRGGSDTTAAALGVALQARAVEIYTDVEGVKTADPRIVAGAKTLPAISYNEVCQLAHEGAKVIHPRAVEIAMQGNIPLWVKGTFSDTPGTLITAYSELAGETAHLKDQTITGITHIPDLTQIQIPVAEAETLTLPLQVFKGLAHAGISVDFINVHPHLMAFTVKQEVCKRAELILREMGHQPVIRHNCAKVAAVGAGMTGRPGVMARIVQALSEQGITILQSADSYTTIWCLVDMADMERAVRALHDHFNLGRH